MARTAQWHDFLSFLGTSQSQAASQVMASRVELVVGLRDVAARGAERRLSKAEAGGSAEKQQ